MAKIYKNMALGLALALAGGSGATWAGPWMGAGTVGTAAGAVAPNNGLCAGTTGMAGAPTGAASAAACQALQWWNMKGDLPQMAGMIMQLVQQFKQMMGGSSGSAAASGISPVTGLPMTPTEQATANALQAQYQAQYQALATQYNTQLAALQQQQAQAAIANGTVVDNTLTPQGIQDALDGKAVDSRYTTNVSYLQGYIAGLNQLFGNVK
ncbi:MAG: hypothetical protein GC129_06840 [Proteobacteria bacterium]|nr:hypothetical protein [Pseudomonadota bacterium]